MVYEMIVRQNNHLFQKVSQKSSQVCEVQKSEKSVYLFTVYTETHVGFCRLKRKTDHTTNAMYNSPQVQIHNEISSVPG